MRRLVFVLGALVSLGIGPAEADAQIRFGVHGEYITRGYKDFSDLSNPFDRERDLAGTKGVGGRLVFSPPALPFGAFASGTYFFPSCDTGDCNYWTAALGARFSLPLPVVQPYLLGGWQWKGFKLDTTDPTNSIDDGTQNNPFIGLGVELDLIAALFVELAMDFDKDVQTTIGTPLSSRPITIKAGIMFGG